MRETGVFFLYLFGCLVLGALLTYPLMQTGWIAHDPHLVMGRLAQVFILLGLWPFLKAMRLNDHQALGYAVPRPQFLNALWWGWLLGATLLSELALILLLLEIRLPTGEADGRLIALIEMSVRALISGLLIGLLEETFFRGALYSAVRRSSGASPAILWSSVLFALVHFMKPHALPEGVVLDLFGTWQLSVRVFTDAFQWRHLDSMVALSLVGVFLGLVRERSGHIGWCMGLHASWIFVIQMTRRLTDVHPSPDAPLVWLVGDYDGVIGWLAAGWIGLAALGLWSFTRHRERKRRV